MTTNCKNCDNPLTGKFCSNCGQKSETHAISLTTLLHDLQHDFFHFDKGILYTSKQLFTRPGEVVRNFILGKRVNYVKPIALVIFLCTLYGILTHLLDIDIFKAMSKNLDSQFAATNEASRSFAKNFNNFFQWVSTHIAVTTLFTIPFYAIGSRFVFKKSGYNYFEHLVLNAYINCQFLIINLLTLPFYLIYKNSNSTIVITNLISLVYIAIYSWTCFDFFTTYSKAKRIWFAILSWIVFYLMYIIVIALIVFIYGYYFI